MVESEETRGEKGKAEAKPPGSLYYAAKLRLTSVVTQIVQKGPYATKESSSLGRSALGVACRDGSTDIVRILLGNGADASVTSKDGWTPLNCASDEGYTVIVKLLLERGADISVPNNDGWTPLHCASAKG
ncbi:ankyrin repeat-containing domain protein, partial [Stachybotrys elegans]